jgi:hypothetical protein
MDFEQCPPRQVKGLGYRDLMLEQPARGEQFFECCWTGPFNMRDGDVGSCDFEQRGTTHR